MRARHRYIDYTMRCTIANTFFRSVQFRVARCSRTTGAERARYKLDADRRERTAHNRSGESIKRALRERARETEVINADDGLLRMRVCTRMRSKRLR